ncbi:MAG: T9SS type A sorting domain-containing protein [Bacteroidetes bacterium]|nr:T9SS type A sorting domain-containing protein [Bacteroidota bacterium]
MKTVLFITFSILLWTSIAAQTINLPAYRQGQYENDTIFTYYGSLTSTGIGSVDFGGGLNSNLISGVKFKMLVDSTDKGASPTHAAFRDSLGTMVAMHKGDTLDIPASFQLFAGKVGFHIIIEGTPSTGGAPYLCDLGYTFTVGNDWIMLIEEKSQKTCQVNISQGIYDNRDLENFNVYPNPASDNIAINTNSQSIGSAYTLINQLGEKVLSGTLTSETTIVDIDQLATGIYLFQIGESKKQVYKIIKE